MTKDKKLQEFPTIGKLMVTPNWDMERILLFAILPEVDFSLVTASKDIAK